MANRNERHVVPSDKGKGWDVVKPGAQRVSSHHATKAEAETRAKQILAKDGGGEAVIHGKDHKIQDSDTIPPGRDPDPPRDKVH